MLSSFTDCHLWHFVFIVHTCNWYLEHRMHLCRNAHRKTFIPWQECCASVGSHDRSPWNAFSWIYCKGLYFIYLCFINNDIFINIYFILKNRSKISNSYRISYSFILTILSIVLLLLKLHLIYSILILFIFKHLV